MNRTAAIDPIDQRKGVELRHQQNEASALRLSMY